MLNISYSQTDAKADVLLVFCDDKKSILGSISAEHATRATKLIERAQFLGTLGDHITDFALDTDAPALAVVGVGALDKLADNIAKVAQAAHKALKNHKTAAVLWGDTICRIHFAQFVRHLALAHYKFYNYKTDAKPCALQEVTVISNKDSQDDYIKACQFANAAASAQILACDVGNEPPNICNPSYMAKQATKLANEYGDILSAKVLGEKDMQDLGMHCFLSVAKGSDQEGKLIVLEYRGKSGKDGDFNNPIALVGKGVTFDTGGISLKPSAGMEDMKFDMGGAAAMLGVAKGLCLLKPKVDVVIVLACAENMPSGSATRPGDVVYAKNGISVEVINTDAEGRLVLADALCYVQDEYAPNTVIDAATLTGACVIALGSHHSGLYCNDEDTLVALESAAKDSHDRVWHMPLGEDYDAQIKSVVADIQNVGGREAGSVTAACFLQRFIKQGAHWAHLDIAGTAWKKGDQKGATGRPVALLMHYLNQQG